MASKQQRDAGFFEVARDGTVEVSAFSLPLSDALSRESKTLLAFALGNTPRMNLPSACDFTSEEEFKSAVDAFRLALDAGFARPASEKLLAKFPVEIAPGTMGGVPIETFTPTGAIDDDRILINLHGGAFFAGSTHVARIESIPMAHNGRFRVISVDYRQGYEHKFPAASQDVAAVYAALLEDYAPCQIGIYGGSAGGMLAAQATAWILEHDLPRPGAIGILSAGTGGSGDGDYFSALGTGKLPPTGPCPRLPMPRSATSPARASMTLWSTPTGPMTSSGPDFPPRSSSPQPVPST